MSFEVGQICFFETNPACDNVTCWILVNFSQTFEFFFFNLKFHQHKFRGTAIKFTKYCRSKSIKMLVGIWFTKAGMFRHFSCRSVKEAVLCLVWAVFFQWKSKTKLKGLKLMVKGIFAHQTKLQYIIIWPNYTIMVHQPGFPWNKGISLAKPPFGVRSCEVAIVWPE